MYHSLYHRVVKGEKPLRINRLSVMEATPPATPRHTMFPLWLLPSGSDQVHG